MIHRWRPRLVLGVLAALGAGCGGAEEVSACAAVPPAVVDELLGPAEAEAYTVGPLAECRWVGAEAEVTLRLEQVLDATQFVEHAIQGTEPDRVRRLAVGEGGVAFAGEALLARQGSHIALVSSRGIDVDRLIGVLDAAVAYLRGLDSVPAR